MKKPLLVILSIGIVSFSGCSGSKKKQQPNVLLIYADDLGWSDIGCYHSTKNETPNLDRLAGEGMLFTDAYASAPICSASRAAIMTGKSPARLHFEFVSTEGKTLDRPLIPPVRTMELPLEEVTLGEVAKDAGYTTAFFGKWHIARHNGAYLKWSDTHGPLQQGFDTGSDNYGSHPYDERNKEPVTLPEGEYPADTLLMKAIDYLSVQEKSDKPFFMVYSTYYVHTPVVPNNSWLIEKYRKLLPDATENEIKYAAFVETMDHYFGLLLQALEDYGLKENTLVIFTSDNGGHPAYTDNTPLHGNKWTLYEGGIREPFIVRWPGVVEAGSRSKEPVIQWDIMPTLCELFSLSTPENVDGSSLLQLFEGNADTLTREDIYWHFPYYHPPLSYEGTKPCSAMREGNYKIIYFYEDEHVELYNLEDDLEEMNDLSIEMPGLAENLKIKLQRTLQDADARLPVANPAYKEKTKKKNKGRKDI